MATAKYKSQTIAAGFWVALTLHQGIAPLRSYVGQVQAVDEHGIRVTLVDWVIGIAAGDDLFVPWSHIEAALIATPEHDVKIFGESARKWQREMIKEAEEIQSSDSIGE